MTFTGVLGDPLAELGGILLAGPGVPPPFMEPARPTLWTEEARMPTWTEEARSVTWSAPTMTILVKRSAEVRVYTMSLASLPEISGGDTVSAVSSVTVTPLTPGAAGADITVTAKGVASGNQGAKATLAGGIDGATYLIEYTVTTAAGATLAGVGYLTINDR